MSKADSRFEALRTEFLRFADAYPDFGLYIFDGTEEQFDFARDYLIRDACVSRGRPLQDDEGLVLPPVCSRHDRRLFVFGDVLPSFRFFGIVECAGDLLSRDDCDGACRWISTLLSTSQDDRLTSFVTVNATEIAPSDIEHSPKGLPRVIDTPSREAGDGGWLALLYGSFTIHPAAFCALICERLRDGQMPHSQSVFSVPDIVGEEIPLSMLGCSIEVRRHNRILRKTVAGRNDAFLKWYESEETVTYHSPANIRDRWNAMTMQHRTLICPTSPHAISEGTNGASVVKAGLCEARKRREDAKPPTEPS